jgi:hypothetical protein
MTVMSMHYYNNPALEAELAYRRERLAQAVQTGRTARSLFRRHRGTSASARG